jgi:methionyl-tRNA formyltransferase
MNITILTDNPNSWILPYVETLKKDLTIRAGSQKHNVTHVFNLKELQGGDLMLILSCEKILPKKYLDLYKSSVVVHPSKVPHGKGWSPLAWQVVEGSNKIPISLFEAVEKVDAGDVYLVDYINLEGHELNEEIKHKQGEITIKMVKYYIENFNSIQGVPQIGDESFYPKRTKKDIELDLNKPLSTQFNLLRVVDNERYPAYFYKDGIEYTLKIYKNE